MFEHETDAVRLGIEFLSALMEKDYRTDPSYDPEDLKDKLLEIEGDVNTLLGNLPYEAIDDDEELEHQYPEEFEDNAELEDEVVECDRVIAQAKALLEAVKERYFGDEVLHAPIPSPATPKPSTEPKTAPASAPAPVEKKKRYINWANVFWIAIIIGLIVWIVLQG